jgi:hypothetical protein
LSFHQGNILPPAWDEIAGLGGGRFCPRGVERPIPLRSAVDAPGERLASGLLRNSLDEANTGFPQQRSGI